MTTSATGAADEPSASLDRGGSELDSTPDAVRNPTGAFDGSAEGLRGSYRLIRPRTYPQGEGPDLLVGQKLGVPSRAWPQPSR
jgi:hypothetical protein